MMQTLTKWYQTEPGRTLLKEELDLLTHKLKQLRGLYLLQIGGEELFCLKQRLTYYYWVNLTQQFLRTDDCIPVQGDFEALPFSPNSMDIVVLPHVLEFTKEPKTVLEEVHQLLAPEGHVIILGFNPLSFLGLSKLMHSRRVAPWCGHFWSALRVQIWLQQQGYHVVTHKSFMFRPPLSHRYWLKRLMFMEPIGQTIWPLRGNVYMLVAKKRVEAKIPLTERLLRRRVEVANSYAEPSTRGLGFEDNQTN